jgi:hypothetical protein
MKAPRVEFSLALMGTDTIISMRTAMMFLDTDVINGNGPH